MNIPLGDILDVVRRSTNDQPSFDALRDIAKNYLRRPWEKLQSPDIQSDILMTTQWLQRSISEYQPTGVCFRLDSLKGYDGFDENVEISMTKLANPQALITDWVPQCEKHGQKLLMWGLERLQNSYLGFGLDYDGTVFANCIFFFGYSGMVLAAAIEQLSPKWDCLFVWGFPDGDLCFLAQSSAQGVKRLAQPEHDAPSFQWGYTVSD